MNKVICNSVDFVLQNEIESMTQTEVILLPDAEWRRLEATEKPVYGSEIKQEDAGPANEETVSLQTRYNIAPLLRSHIAFHFVLRLQTDTETFYVGTPTYPARLEITSDRLFDNLSFTALSPAV
jgi:hypothetical protein